MALATSLFAILPTGLSAQSTPEDDDILALSSPSARERAEAVARLPEATLLKYYRKLLTDGGNATQLIGALDRLRAEKKTEDIALIVKYIGDLDPGVAEAAMGALRTFGRDALKAVENLPANAVDASTRKDVLERLLRDHIYLCCQRDAAINTFHLDFDGRFDELYAIDQDVDELMFRMLRESVSDIRDDISNNRYYYYGGTRTYERPFIDYGALAVAALGSRHPERLNREVGELAEVENQDNYYYWGNTNRSPVTIELATFFARQGNTALMDKLINDMESGTRWMQAGQMLGLQVRVAAMQITGLGEWDAALERLNENVKQAGSALSSTVSQAHYLRARILLHLNEEGAALHALEESMEASDSAQVLTLVDTTFKALAPERRFQAVLDYCRLAARRLAESQRPWQPAPEKE